MSQRETTTPTIEVPVDMSEDEAVEFIRQAIWNQGGDPNTARPIAINSGGKTLPEGFDVGHELFLGPTQAGKTVQNAVHGKKTNDG